MTRRADKAPPSSARPSMFRPRRLTPEPDVSPGRYAPLIPKQRVAPEAETVSDHPRLNWVLVPDATGRMRPEARWS